MHAVPGAKYRLIGDDADEPWGYTREAAGLFVPVPSPPDDKGSRRVELLGCAPQGSLRHAVEHLGTRHATVGNAYLDFLDTAGQCIGSYFVNGITIEQAGPSPTEPELFDVTVSLTCDELRPEAEWPWELFRSGRPVPNGMWRPLGPAARRAWLSVALHRRSYLSRPDDPPGTRYELDGRYIVDEDSFYCAIGEAVNGPGGYFGWNLDALDDCMRGGFGATPPFTIVWTEYSTARPYLEVSALPGATTYFEAIREICAQRQVDLVFR
ncbi:hypothetical protein B0T36_04965 [Nocardia donostiensis]|uniref:barstar family protein n=1 Tax=Nocardia donostiensis TaxID=1538463 RepID=UPI0009D9E0A6|nr:hypothetical protein B0T36_04965 [Nocardia donostiensis]